MTIELVFLGCSCLGLLLGARAWLTGNRARRPGEPKTDGMLTLAAFVVAFGAVGFLVTRYYDQAAILSVPTAIAAGLGGAWISGFIPSTHDADDEAVTSPSLRLGTVGRLTLPIRENGLGELAYSDRGTTRTSGAKSLDGRAIEKGAEVMVTRYENRIAWVRRLEDVLPGVDEAVRRIDAASAERRFSALGSMGPRQSGPSTLGGMGPRPSALGQRERST